MSDRSIGLMLLVISGFFYWQTLFFKRPQFAQFEQMGPEFFPRGILIVLALLSLALIVRGKGSLLPRWNLGSVRTLATRYRDVVLSLALFPVYVMGITLIGFLYSTMLYLVVMQSVLKPRKGLGLLLVVAGSVTFSWALVQLFQGYLHVVLPAGSLF